jgi:acetyl-CoA carboxylase carboxyl transferase subunit alpha
MRMKNFILDFEKPIVELEQKIDGMRELSLSGDVDISDEIEQLENKALKLREDVFKNLTRWQRVQLARHPQRPFTLDYVNRMATRFQELHGDRSYRDDHAIVSGIGTIDGRDISIVGHQKGRKVKENLDRNFGMPHPEGYRKAIRIMKLSEKFERPILTLVDTQGAYPGLGAEERGQAEAIAHNLFEMSQIRVPIVSVIIGEGGSGGALAIALADRVLMLENSVYSVITPEGCASILYRDAAYASKAAEAMKVTAADLMELGVIDEIIPEPFGGAQRDHDAMAKTLQETVTRHFDELCKIDPDQLIEDRIERFSKIGVYESAEEES